MSSWQVCSSLTIITILKQFNMSSFLWAVCKKQFIVKTIIQNNISTFSSTSIFLNFLFFLPFDCSTFWLFYLLIVLPFDHSSFCHSTFRRSTFCHSTFRHSTFCRSALSSLISKASKLKLCSIKRNLFQ